MAAPNNAYRNKSLWMRGGTTNYEHKVAILQEDKATMLERFYLDDLVSVKVDGTNDGVIGVVIIGGDNEKMHNITTRGGVGRVRVNGQTARLLNDAGLNTKGKANIEEVVVRWGNLIVLNIKYDASFYDNSSNLGLRWRIEGGSGTWYNVTFLTFLQASSSLTTEQRITPGVQIGQTLEIQLTHTNPEGTYFSDSFFVTAEESVYSFDALVRTSPCSDAGQVNDEVWMFDSQVDQLASVTQISEETGIYLYDDYTMTSTKPSGWYLLSFVDDKVFFVDDNGQITHYRVCAPELPILYVASDQYYSGSEPQPGEFVVTADLSEAYSSDIIVNGRIDTSTTPTVDAKYFTLTIPAGSVRATSSPYNLTDGVYYFFDVTSNVSGQTIQVQQGSIN